GAALGAGRGVAAGGLRARRRWRQGRHVARGGGGHRGVLLAGRRGDGAAAGPHGRRRGAPGRRRLSPRHRRGVPPLLPSHLGAAPGPHPAGGGQPRVQDEGRGGVLPLLRRAGGAGRQGMVQLPARRLARGGAEQRRAPGRRFRAGALAGVGPGGEPLALHAGVLSPPAVQLRPARRQGARGRRVPGDVRPRGGRGAERPRPSLRALRPAGPGRARGPRARHPPVRRRHGGRALVPAAQQARAQQRSPFQQRPRRAAPRFPQGRLRVGVRPHRGPPVRGPGPRGLPL
ncbi:MAG: Alkaline phosphatase, partial [uncultured Gemmatimonadetes bacterium]